MTSPAPPRLRSGRMYNSPARELYLSPARFGADEPLSLAGLLGGRRLLVVGGTGFLGKVWCSLLLTRFPTSATCTWSCGRRAGSVSVSASSKWCSRVPSSTPLRQLHQHDFESFVAGKVTPIFGDVAQPLCGIDAPLRDEMRGPHRRRRQRGWRRRFRPAARRSARGQCLRLSEPRCLGQGSRWLSDPAHQHLLHGPVVALVPSTSRTRARFRSPAWASSTPKTSVRSERSPSAWT